jgi:hypothetical protein
MFERFYTKFFNKNGLLYLVLLTSYPSLSSFFREGVDPRLFLISERTAATFSHASRYDVVPHLCAENDRRNGENDGENEDNEGERGRRF